MILRTWEVTTDPKNNPVPYGPVTHDPHYGFNYKRKERGTISILNLKSNNN